MSDSPFNSTSAAKVGLPDTFEQPDNALLDNFDPPLWPECSTCSAAYVKRRAFDMSHGGRQIWIWQRDCKHKAEAQIAVRKCP